MSTTPHDAARAAFAAVDLGASSGRVIVGRVGPGRLEMAEVHRFPNEPVRLPTGMHWDILRLYREVIGGLRESARAADGADGLVSVGVDSWGVDHGLLDSDGALLGNPIHYRDERWAPAVEAFVRSPTWTPDSQKPNRSGMRSIVAAASREAVPRAAASW